MEPETRGHGESPRPVARRAPRTGPPYQRSLSYERAENSSTPHPLIRKSGLSTATIFRNYFFDAEPTGRAGFAASVAVAWTGVDTLRPRATVWHNAVAGREVGRAAGETRPTNLHPAARFITTQFTMFSGHSRGIRCESAACSLPGWNREDCRCGGIRRQIAC
jgi:hypothetical protein